MLVVDGCVDGFFGRCLNRQQWNDKTRNCWDVHNTSIHIDCFPRLVHVVDCQAFRVVIVSFERSPHRRSSVASVSLETTPKTTCAVPEAARSEILPVSSNDASAQCRFHRGVFLGEGVFQTHKTFVI